MGYQRTNPRVHSYSHSQQNTLETAGKARVGVLEYCASHFQSHQKIKKDFIVNGVKHKERFKTIS